MRNIDSNFQNALLASRDTGIAPVRYVFITAKERDTGNPASLGFWTWDEDIEATVIGATTGLPVVRTYFGGLNIEIAAIKRVSDMTVQSIEISFSQISAATQELVRGYDVRLAKVEVHEALLDPRTGSPVSYPFPVFLGEVDAAPITTPAVGGEGAITLTVVSDAISMLTRTNPRKSSYEAQKRRQNDQWGKFASTLDTWKVKWGQRS